MVVLVGVGVAALLFSLALAPPTGAGAATPHRHPRTTLPAVERQVMCVTCKIPLNVAQSPQADRERAYIQGLIDEGQTAAQIKRALVNQYGPTVLALPSDHGFNLAAYLVPIVAVGGVLVLLLLMLPRWRRHARREDATRGAPLPRLSTADASRLAEDLARHDI
jgi:cytochrome c-type biogenesis protein CcmH